MSTATSTPALAYLRVSGLSQVDGDGFTRQLEAIGKRAASQGMEIVGDYRDEGVSGTPGLDERPGLASLLERVLSNGVRTVIVERSDRLARDLIQGELILEEFRRAGVAVLEAESGSDLTSEENPTVTLIRQVLGAVAQFDKSSTVSKLRAARIRKRRENGKCEGQKGYGPEVIREAKRLRRRSPKTGAVRSFATIASELNAGPFPTRRGGPWTASSVRTILQWDRKGPRR